MGKISAQPHTFIMHTVLCLKKTMAVTIARICNLLALEKEPQWPTVIYNEPQWPTVSYNGPQ